MLIAMPGQHHYRRVYMQTARVRQHVQAVAVRQLKIQERAVKGLAEEQFKSGGAVACFGDVGVQTRHFDGAAGGDAIHFIIIYQQYRVMVSHNVSVMGSGRWVFRRSGIQVLNKPGQWRARYSVQKAPQGSSLSIQ